MAKQRFLTLCQSVFYFLREDFGFSEKGYKETNFEISILYTNKTTGIKIIYDKRENLILIQLIRLKNGNIPAYEIFINEKTEINTFYLHNLLELRAQDYSVLVHVPVTEDNWDPALNKYAAILRKYASDILSGNFESFKLMQQIVKKRKLVPGTKT